MMRTSPCAYSASCSGRAVNSVLSHRLARQLQQQQSRAGLQRLRCQASKAKVSVFVPVETQLGEEIAVAGNVPELGSWDASKAPMLRWTEGSVWTSVIELPTGKNVEYKYIKKRGNQVLQWQPGSNMQISLPEGTITAEVRDTWQGVHQSMSTLTDDDEDDETDEVAAAAIAAIKAKNLAAAKQPAGAVAGSTKAAAAGSAAAAKAALASEAGARASASASRTSSGASAGDAASHTKGAKSSTSGSAVRPQTGSGSAQSSSSTSNNIVSADGLTKTVDEELAEEKARVAALTVLSVLGISSTTALLVSLKVIPDPGLAGIDLSSLSGLSKLDLSGLVSKAQLAVSGLSSIPSSGIAS